jgi:hypothetical protein
MRERQWRMVKKTMNKLGRWRAVSMVDEGLFLTLFLEL